MNVHAGTSRKVMADPVVRHFDERIDRVMADVEQWRGWAVVTDPQTPVSAILKLVAEIYRSISMYQPITTEAGFHMIGRLPKSEWQLMQRLASHKAEEAEHGEWVVEDFLKLTGEKLDARPPSPASFAVRAVWWEMARSEDPFGYLGAEYLFEQLTALVTQKALSIIQARDLPPGPLRFLIAHATEDAKHAMFLRHLIRDVSQRHPGSVAAMDRCFDYFQQVYPLPLWDEAYLRAGLAK